MMLSEILAGVLLPPLFACASLFFFAENATKTKLQKRTEKQNWSCVTYKAFNAMSRKPKPQTLSEVEEMQTLATSFLSSGLMAEHHTAGATDFAHICPSGAISLAFLSLDTAGLFGSAHHFFNPAGFLLVKLTVAT